MPTKSVADRLRSAGERDDGKAVIIKGDAAASRVIQRIKSADADEAMPPASTHKKLKAQEIALLEQWIGQGAVYESHWSFIPPAKIEPPQDNTKWARSAVDRFVAARLKESGLIPNDDEDRARCGTEA